MHYRLLVLMNMGAIVAASVLAFGPSVPAHVEPGEQIDTNSPSVSVELKVLRDGGLSVIETVRVPGGQEAVRQAPLRVPTSDGRDQLFTVKDVAVQGGGTAEVAEDRFSWRLPAGESVVSYTVQGTVTDLVDAQQVRWLVASGWQLDLGMVEATFIAPVPEVSSVDCSAGPFGSTRACTLTEISHTDTLRIEQRELARDQRMDLTANLPIGTVPANATFAAPESLASAFAFTPVVWIGLAVLVLAFLAIAAYVWWARRRDMRASSADVAPVDVLLHRDGRTFFASPDGVLPGQIGTVSDGSVDAVDISATIVDLAVRNYLWIAEVPGGQDSGAENAAHAVVDWQLSRRNPADDKLSEYERMVFETLLPAERETVLVSELRALASADFAKVRDAMYADVVRQGWFSGRPDRTHRLMTWLGVGVTALGVAATVILALTVGHALLGLGLAILGAVLVVAATSLPVRTKRGRTLAGHMRGLANHLRTIDPAALAEADRELVFSRSLPYALVLGLNEHWLTSFAELNLASDGDAGLYWYGAVAETQDLSGFRTRFMAFVTACNGVLTEAGHARAIEPLTVPA